MKLKSWVKYLLDIMVITDIILVTILQVLNFFFLL